MVNKWDLKVQDIEWEELEAEWVNHKEDDFITTVEAGVLGHNEGFDNGLVTVNAHIHGTHRGRYILIGADSGVGKTTIADFMYIFSLWLDCKKRGVKIYIKYFSFEISATEKKARWVSQWIKRVHNLDLSSDYIMGRIPGKLLIPFHLKLVKQGYSLVQEMLKDIEIIDYSLGPTGMLNRVLDHYSAIGTIDRDKPKDDKKGSIRAYIPNDPLVVTAVVTDHLALINTEAGCISTKQIMDRWSMYSVQLKNIFKTTVIQIQQFSTSMMSAYREQKKTEVAIAPQRLDFGDSSYTYRDADLVFGIVKPIQYSLKKFFGYDLTGIEQYFLALYLMKNRHGPSDRLLPIFMNPISGMFWDMPPPGSIQAFIAEANRLNSI